MTPRILTALERLENLNGRIIYLPMTHKMQARLRETARLVSTHFSTKIEGNRLSLDEVIDVLGGGKHFKERKRDEQEIQGYYNALTELEKTARSKEPITEHLIQKLHAMIMSKGQKRTPYRAGQNVIRDSQSGAIVYLPPEAHDVGPLMKDLVDWITSTEHVLACPLRAAVAHYQFATIHPYYDGNGRAARLLATLILHLGGFDLKGFYSLEEYYAKKLNAYYQALTAGPSHNYYLGRAEADITPWVEYFIDGMLHAFEKVKDRADEALLAGRIDESHILRQLDPRQRKVLDLFDAVDVINAQDVASCLKIKIPSAQSLCRKWALGGFFLAEPNPRPKQYRLGSF